MASRRLEDLDPDLQQRAGQVLDLCDSHGVEMLIYCTHRSLEEQAKLFRRSRKLSTITRRANYYYNRGFDFLGDILMNVGPQEGKLGAHVTCAGPGESWHNYRLAFDCVPMVGGKALWRAHEPQWLIYGNAVNIVGLEWAGDWTRFREFPHAQSLTSRNPLRAYSPTTIRQLLDPDISASPK